MDGAPGVKYASDNWQKRFRLPGTCGFSSTVVESRNLPYAFMHNGSSRALLFTDTGQADENSRVHHPFGRKKVELSLPEFGEIKK
jgi:hypothetical protein